MANYYELRLQAISFKKTGQENNGKQLLISVTVSVFRQDSFILVVTSNDIASDKNEIHNERKRPLSTSYYTQIEGNPKSRRYSTAIGIQ